MSMSELRVSLDNGATWQPAHQVRVIASDPLVENEVHYNITSEGVVTDVVDDGEVLGTESKTHFDKIAELE